MGERARRQTRCQRRLVKLFESIPPPSVAERARACAFPPLLAYIALQVYFTLLPLLGGVPFRVVRILAGVLALAGAYGLVGVLRLVWTEWRALDVRAALWLLAAAAIAILSLRTAIALRFYWMFSGKTATLLAPEVRRSVVRRCTALSNSA